MSEDSESLRAMLPPGAPGHFQVPDQPANPGSIESIQDLNRRQRAQEAWRTAFLLESIAHIWANFCLAQETANSIDADIQGKISCLFPSLKNCKDVLDKLARWEASGRQALVFPQQEIADIALIFSSLIHDLTNALNQNSVDKAHFAVTPEEARKVVKSKFAGCDLQLMSSVSHASGIQTAGKSLSIVAVVDRLLHFRIFDGDGELVVDTDERKVYEQPQQVYDFRKQLEILWPPLELTKGMKVRVLEDLRSIEGHANFLLVQVEVLRKQLETLWPPHELTNGEKVWVLDALTSIVGHSQFQLELGDPVAALELRHKAAGVRRLLETIPVSILLPVPTTIVAGVGSPAAAPRGAAEVIENNRASPEDEQFEDRPNWDSSTRVLSYKGRRVKFTKKAKRCIPLLNELFQKKEGSPPAGNPFKDDDNEITLRRTVSDLNRTMQDKRVPIHFIVRTGRPDWEPVEKTFE